MAARRRLVTITGETSLETVRRGTGSEHESLVLTTGEGRRLVLKALGKNPFERDEAGPRPGERIEARGYIVGSELRYTKVRRL